MRRDNNYDDRDEYSVGDDYASPRQRNGNGSMRKQAKGASHMARRETVGEGGAKQRSSHNWPPRSKYRIRPW